MDKCIYATGIKTNNLKNIDVEIPKGKITAIVGVSGAGKNSLAFDTIYAEGYLRYIESISPYVRQFLDKIDKPPVDNIDGLLPTISFKQKKPAKNPRSIVATSLDIYDYLRVIYSKISEFYCPTCHQLIKKYSIDEIILELLETDSYEREEKIDICFEYTGDVAFLINRGYYFYIEEGQRKRIDSTIKDKTVFVLIDRVEIEKENKSRIFEALDKSISFGNGSAIVFYKGRQILFPADLYCPTCNTHYPPPDEHLFSFNSPKGACPKCKGFGDVQEITAKSVLDFEKSLEDGAAIPFNSPTTRRYGEKILKFAKAKGINIATPVKNLTDSEIAYIMNGDKRFAGIKGFFDWLKTKSYKVQARVFISRYSCYSPCTECGGSRLNSLARSFKVNGLSIADFLSFTIEEAQTFTKSLNPDSYKNNISPEVFTDILSRFDFLVQTGLPYIQLNRPTFTLSRGEYQRINLAFILGSNLSDSLLILDQPSSDLHPYDYEKLKSFISHLKDNGNTLLIIEHNSDIVRHCDYILELGPLAGEKGGQLVFHGDKESFFKPPASKRSIAPTFTQTYFNRSFTALEREKNPLTDWVTFENANAHNLKNFDVDIPWNAFTVITGVSGAGKTTLLYDEFYLKPSGKVNRSHDCSDIPEEDDTPGKTQKKTRGGKKIKEIVFIDPSTQHIRPLTIVAGFFGVFASLREIFAGLKESRLQNFTAGHFSFNSAQGQCTNCKGKGFNEIEMQFLPSVNLQCSQCSGTGFKPDVLKVKYKSWNIHEILDLSIDHFIDIIEGEMPASQMKILSNISSYGLGYLKLGQRLKTLSTGELQRIKLIKHLNLKQKDTLFLIDEPTFGMHPYDVEMVKQLIDKLIADHNTVVVAEHNIGLIAHADYIIELGPKGGNEGGFLVFQGKPREMITSDNSITGSYFKQYL